MTYTAAENRYDSIPYRRVGRRLGVLPALSLGLWHNFGDSTPIDTQRACCARRSTWASTISTWPTTTARRTAVPRSTSAVCCVKTSSSTATS